MSSRDHPPHGKTNEEYAQEVIKRWPSGSVTYRESAAVKRYTLELVKRIQKLEERVCDMPECKERYTK